MQQRLYNLKQHYTQKDAQDVELLNYIQTFTRTEQNQMDCKQNVKIAEQKSAEENNKDQYSHHTEKNFMDDIWMLVWQASNMKGIEKNISSSTESDFEIYAKFIEKKWCEIKSPTW